MKRKIKFLIVDDQKIIRESLTEKLKCIFEKSQIAEASGGKSSLEVMEQFKPDIVFMDISMPEMDGIEATNLILSRFPQQKIIAFSMNDNDQMLNKMLKAGAVGYLLKTDNIDDYQTAIQSVLRGKLFVSRNVMV